ncbi:MAG: lipopolysaccharide biosynthesis protein, partial [Bacteroidales bacterium]
FKENREKPFHIMAGMKSLAKDTALYGLSSIIGKLLNWLLVPLYVVKVNDYEFGEVTQLYAWTALLLVFLTYGLETGFFRFANKEEHSDPKLVYSTCMGSLWGTTALFLVLIFLFLNPLATSMGFAGQEEYLGMMAIVIAIDVLSSLPFALLRYEKRPLRFASIKLLFVFLNISLNLFFLVLCPVLYHTNPTLTSLVYQPEKSGVFYIVLSNLIASAFMMTGLIPQLVGTGFRFDKKLWIQILRYSFPLLILGVAGIINQTADKILFPMLVEDAETAKSQLGIYGANYKFAVVMIMFIQAFRFAYEPFVFGKHRNADNKQAYIQAMKYFIIFGLFIFLSVGLLIGFLPEIPVVARHIHPEYFSGLAVVPIVMMAEFFFGIFFNLSFWYKLTDKTRWGAYFSVSGCILTIVMNILLVPHFGYMACAWTAFTVYLLMMSASYYFGQKYYPIRYEVKNALVYFSLTIVLFGAGIFVPISSTIWLFLFRLSLIFIYSFIVIKKDLPLKEIPFINKLIR